METLSEFFNYTFSLTENVSIRVSGILLVLVVIFITSMLLNFIRRVLTRKLPGEDKVKFKILFNYCYYVIQSKFIIKLCFFSKNAKNSYFRIKSY